MSGSSRDACPPGTGATTGRFHALVATLPVKIAAYSNGSNGMRTAFARALSGDLPQSRALAQDLAREFPELTLSGDTVKRRAPTTISWRCGRTPTRTFRFSSRSLTSGELDLRCRRAEPGA
jgi:hypothetical protein